MNDLGREQAANLGKNTPFRFEILFSSDLKGAIDSSDIAFPEVEKYQDKRFWEEANKNDWRKTDGWQP